MRGLLVFDGERMELRNRKGQRREWLQGDDFEHELRRLADLLPMVARGTVVGELIAERFRYTMAALTGSGRFRDRLRFVVFDVPFLGGADLR
jgi:hypothetical protein